MKKRPPEQLNKPAGAEEFTLESILEEFGAPQEKKPAPKTPEQPEAERLKEDTIRFTPIRSAPKKADENAPVKTAFSENKDSTAPFPLVSGKEPPKMPPVRELPEPEIKIEASCTKKEKQECPPPEPNSPAALFEKYRKGSVFQIVRTFALLLISLLCVFLLVYYERDPAFAPFLLHWQGLICLGLLCLAVLLSYEVFWVGFRALFSRRFSLYLLALPLSVLALFHGVSMLSLQGANYCPIAVLLLAYLQYSLRLQRSGMVHTLYTVCNFTSALGIFEAPQTKIKNDSLRCDAADLDDYLAKLHTPDLAEKLFGVYAPCLFLLSAGLSIALARLVQTDLLLTWLLLLLCAMPFSAMLSFFKPYRALSRRLAKAGGALAGWHSAESFGKEHTIILRDEDLFPQKDISSNGMKLYGAFSAPFVISNALAALDAVESPLTPVFEELLAAHNGARMYASSYRLYDNDGIGAAVNGEDILLGSLSFMRSMGVHMPEGAKVRQAVYISIRGELCGVFAIRYKPNPASKKALRAILSNRNFSVVIAARDFLVNPELIASKYELSPEGIIFPDYNIRVRLTEVDPNAPTVQGALIAQESFPAFASTVASGRTLRLSTTLSAILSLLSGITGLLICAALLFWGTGISPLQVAVFQLLWTFLAGLSSDILLKF